MSDEKPKPADDLKNGLNLLFRAAKGAIDKIPTDKIEGALKDGAKEVGKALETVANEVDKVFHKSPGASQQPEPTTAEAQEQHDADAKKNAPPEHFDDAYAPEPVPGKGGPRVG
jgi:hypothetical protein